MGSDGHSSKPVQLRSDHARASRSGHSDRSIRSARRRRRRCKPIWLSGSKCLASISQKSVFVDIGWDARSRIPCSTCRSILYPCSCPSCSHLCRGPNSVEAGGYAAAATRTKRVPSLIAHSIQNGSFECRDDGRRTSCDDPARCPLGGRFGHRRDPRRAGSRAPALPGGPGPRAASAELHLRRIAVLQQAQSRVRRRQVVGPVVDAARHRDGQGRSLELLVKEAKGFDPSNPSPARATRSSFPCTARGACRPARRGS